MAFQHAAADQSGNKQLDHDIAQNKRLGRGVNILGYDPIWKDLQKARFQEQYFRLIKEAGFSHVRINLHPFRDAKFLADGVIAAEWFTTLDWAVQHALDNKLMVILDFHEFHAMGDDPLGHKEQFLGVWRQIAEHCKQAPDSVIFEILNEPNKNLTPDLWNAMLGEALRVIRQSNPRRTVIVGPTSWNGIQDLAKLQLPDDDRNLIVTIHYYQPFAFTHQGAAFAGLKDKTGVSWNGTEEQRQAIATDFDKAQAWAKAHGRPLYLGEFGVYDKAEMASRARWTAFIVRQAERRGWSLAWWQFDGDFVLYDVSQNRWTEPILHALTDDASAQHAKGRKSSPAIRPIHANVAYGPHPHQLLDVYLPPAGAGPSPVLLWFGNLWKPQKHAAGTNELLSSHCAVVAVQMRTMIDAVAEKAPVPISYCLLDARRAVQFVRLHAAQWNLDPERIAVGGSSQGNLPALYVACEGEKADPKAVDPVERLSTKVLCMGGLSPGAAVTIDPQHAHEWVPPVEWGEPAWGCTFAEALKHREELLPKIKQWSPDWLVSKDSPPIYLQFSFGLTKPAKVKEMGYFIHSPQWGLAFQKLAQQRGATCYVGFSDHPSEKYKDLWDFFLKELGAASAPTAK
jgi:endoglucanase